MIRASFSVAERDVDTRPASSADERTRLADLTDFLIGLGFPSHRTAEVISRFRRERGAMIVDDAAARLAEWVTDVRRSVDPSASTPLAPEEARMAFVLSGAAMWHSDTLFQEPHRLSPAHRFALASGHASIVPTERPLPMPEQSLAPSGRRRGERIEPVIRRVSWVPSR